MNGVTFRTGPGSDFEVEKAENTTTMATSLAAWEEGVDAHEGASVPPGFVFQLAHHLAPSYVAYRFRQVWVLDHVLHLQALCADHLVFVDQARGELVQEVGTAVRDTGVDACDSRSGFLPVPGAFLFSAEIALGAGQTLLVLFEISRVAYFLPVAEDGGVRQAQIDADHVGCDRLMLDVLLDAEGNEIPADSVLRNGDGGRRSCKVTRPPDAEISGHLSKLQAFSIPREGGSSILDRLAAVLLLELGVARTLLEEVDEGPVQMAERLLKRYARHLSQPQFIRLTLDTSEGRRKGAVAQRLLAFPIRLRACRQRPVVDVPDAPKRFGQDNLLFVRGVESIFVGSLNHRLNILNIRAGVNLKRQNVLGRKRSAFPTPKSDSSHA